MVKPNSLLSNRSLPEDPNESVSVYCRVKPLDHDSSEDSCVQVVNEKTLRLFPPQSSRAFFNGKTLDYSFKRVFSEDASQKQVFVHCGLDLVRQLLNGQNGLLFTYGVTGSGKTYTMQGTPADGGVMTRAMDMLFNSLGDRLTAKKFMLEPNKFNDFCVLSQSEAGVKCQKEMAKDLKKKSGFSSRCIEQELCNRQPDNSVFEEIDGDHVYAVFISCFEIYNKYVYDLLDETIDPVSGKPRFESRILREDAYGNMFVFGGTEVEVRNSKEALTIFHRGQKRRRVAETQLNIESSRSHSIFNIRLVKCHPTKEGKEIDPEKSCIVSQLALVDLAGSERTSRTKNTGQRLREAGNINNSLMNLRACIEKLRENQMTGKSEKVPYRNEKLTHLFKNYFEGHGFVKMIVNVNPRVSDYEETLNVLQFAEVTQEVDIERIEQGERNLLMTSSMKKSLEVDRENEDNKIWKDSEKAEVDGSQKTTYCPLYSLGPALPSMDFDGPDDLSMVQSLQSFLEERIAKRDALSADHNSKVLEFRKRLQEIQEGNVLLRQEISALKAERETDKTRIDDLEIRVARAHAAKKELKRQHSVVLNTKTALENELDERERELHHWKTNAQREFKRLRSRTVRVSEQSESISEKKSLNENNQNDEGTDETSTDGDEFKVEITTEVYRGGVGKRIAELEARCGGSSKRTKK